MLGLHNYSLPTPVGNYLVGRVPFVAENFSADNRKGVDSYEIYADVCEWYNTLRKHTQLFTAVHVNAKLKYQHRALERTINIALARKNGLEKSIELWERGRSACANNSWSTKPEEQHHSRNSRRLRRRGGL